MISAAAAPTDRRPPDVSAENGWISENLPIECAVPDHVPLQSLLRASGLGFSKASSPHGDEPTERPDKALHGLTRDNGSRPPLVSALGAAAEEDVACFHFPGHRRGSAAPPSLAQLIGPAAFATTCRSSPTQREASKLFGSSETWFLVGGTTCGVQASVMATCSPGETLILPRNSHISATSAMVISGAVPKYVLPEYDPHWGIAGGVSPSQVAAAMEDLARDGKRPAAMLVTSPTYHGICSRVGEIAGLCHLAGVPLVVDEAHGGHFKFHREFPAAAMEQGADLAVQSTHKVLCSLTQSSMLHLAGDMVDRDRVGGASRPCRAPAPATSQLSENPAGIFDEAVALASEARDRIGKIAGISVLGSSGEFSGSPVMDPLRVTVLVAGLGISGYEADEILAEEHRILSELAGPSTVTFAINLGTRREDVERLAAGLGRLSASAAEGSREVQDIGGRRRAAPLEVPFEVPSVALSPREAFFARKRKVEVRRSAGEVCGELICTYPPGIPEALEFLLEAREKGAAISGAADCQLSSIVVCDS
ncbi:unnamed protein product [Spirodela intermedia]|uniref:Orn/Lys/Arg decarboxylases family 1 pyridoxal-P attachment site domain-containing protein n=1 Tax=Spirodela intermedia TaxID=51605 RepID=A0A7I8J1Z7_SPIIN|nr:unnamed protein product [Spirodela intermedia]CAA6664089.1 unnamed protein product [Spirodela intermedia]